MVGDEAVKYLIRCDVTTDVFRSAMLIEPMRSSFRRVEDVIATVESYDRGACQLWSVPGNGFLVLSWGTDGRFNYMFVERAAGRVFYNRFNVESMLVPLAKETNSDLILAECWDERVERLLRWLGFHDSKIPPSEDGLKRLEKEV